MSLLRLCKVNVKIAAIDVQQGTFNQSNNISLSIILDKTELNKNYLSSYKIEENEKYSHIIDSIDKNASERNRYSV
jgi:hypothetical protein